MKEEFEKWNSPLDDEQSLEERVKELEHLNDGLNEDISKITEMFLLIQHENENLKTQNQILSSMIRENEPKEEIYEKFVETLNNFKFSDVSDVEEDNNTQK